MSLSRLLSFSQPPKLTNGMGIVILVVRFPSSFCCSFAFSTGDIYYYLFIYLFIIYYYLFIIIIIRRQDN